MVISTSTHDRDQLSLTESCSSITHGNTGGGDNSLQADPAVLKPSVCSPVALLEKLHGLLSDHYQLLGKCTGA